MWVWSLLFMLLVAAVSAQNSNCRTPSGSAGVCIPTDECPELFNLLQRIRAGTEPRSSLTILKQSICGFVNNKPNSCCPLTSKPRDLLPEVCGVSALTEKIIGGTDASLLDWPWIVILRGREPGVGSRFFCGGTLISDRYVLTAAHCVHSSSGFELEYVRAGEYDLSRDMDCEKGKCRKEPQDMRVENIIVHEEYLKVRGCNRCHDIALLRLAQPLIMDPVLLSPVCLPRSLEQDLNITDRNFNNRFGWAAGWGTIDPTKPVFRSVLQHILLPISDEFCGRLLNDYPDKNMVVCAGGEAGKDTCRGDSGGPLIVSNPQVTRFYLVGIVSKGPRFCGTERSQGVYTNVNHYMPWILQHLRP
ncbi:CLIP domain-containing serine protease 2-like [Homarus americanus]|uniref:CLIP domain-containing serine protease 2-like n=1 Tax=Homarus americanus TaxID=6706 RepID=UPI001C45D287|nr:CLIP domain-containing serine protease 2-like [Homarus americanus]